MEVISDGSGKWWGLIVVAKLYLKAKRRIIIFLHKTLPACDEMTRLMSQSLDRRLRLRERVTLWLHLRICLRCARYLRQIVVLRKLARRPSRPLIVEDSAPALTAEACERIKNALERKSL